MNKIKNDETIGLHHVPFTIMWMSVAAVIAMLALISMYILWSMEYRFDVINNWINWMQDRPQIIGILIGIYVGILASIGQTWLLRQRYGSVPRYWRLMTILGWGWAGNAMMFIVDYYLSERFGVYGLFAWFIIPVIFQTIALWSYVRRAWLYGLAGTVPALIATTPYLTGMNEEVYGLLLGTLAYTLLTALVLIKLMSQQRTMNLKAEGR